MTPVSAFHASYLLKLPEICPVKPEKQTLALTHAMQRPSFFQQGKITTDALCTDAKMVALSVGRVKQNCWQYNLSAKRISAGFSYEIESKME
ncbi:hypothetical protein ACO0K9_14520 [Undibacterium sp. Ji50W]|uniref:hypothetical protein n=1 Tax=Undibacterium sp. Ji50W TaxID=3413041 RepID=UPI003BF16C9B